MGRAWAAVPLMLCGFCSALQRRPPHLQVAPRSVAIVRVRRCCMARRIPLFLQMLHTRYSQVVSGPLLLSVPSWPSLPRCVSRKCLNTVLSTRRRGSLPLDSCVALLGARGDTGCVGPAIVECLHWCSAPSDTIARCMPGAWWPHLTVEVHHGAFL